MALHCISSLYDDLCLPVSRVQLQDDPPQEPHFNSAITVKSLSNKLTMLVHFLLLLENIQDWELCKAKSLSELMVLEKKFKHPDAGFGKVFSG